MSTLAPELLDAAALENGGDLAGALVAYSARIAREPGDLHAWARVGMVWLRLMKWQQAADNFVFVLRIDPDHAVALHGLAIARYQLGAHADARVLANQAAALAPHDWRIHASRAYICATSQRDPAATLALYRDWGQRFADPLTAAAEPLPPLDGARRDPHRRLRIGYVSGDLREHSVAFFMEPVFAHHTSEVEVFVYSTGPRDAVTERIAGHVRAANWFDVRETSDDALLGLIRAHGIDVLIDLSGHTEGQRLFVFARRAAPVQVTWLGFMHPLGMQAMDYRLTDRGTDPAGNEAHHSETLFRLACMASYAPPADAPLAPEPPLLANGGRPTLVSLNNSKKVTDAMLGVWAQILARRPDAQLLMMAQEQNAADAEAQMRPRLERAGLPASRVHLSPQLPLADFMQLGCIADLALDTSPVSGGTTTLHALWMGLPLVTLRAPDAAAGASAATLAGLGYDDWIADDAEGYVARALALLADPERLRVHRATVRARMAANPLMDHVGRVRDLEHAVRLMWVNHLLGERRFLDLSTSVADAAGCLAAADDRGSASAVALEYESECDSRAARIESEAPPTQPGRLVR